jgi:hypothetical protein
MGVAESTVFFSLAEIAVYIRKGVAFLTLYDFAEYELVWFS